MYKNRDLIGEGDTNGVNYPLSTSIITLTECMPGETVYLTISGPTSTPFLFQRGTTTFSGALILDLDQSPVGISASPVTCKYYSYYSQVYYDHVEVCAKSV